jgi:hypothetical protein
MGLDIFVHKVKYHRLGYFRKVNFLVKFFESKGFDVDHQIPLSFDKEIAEELLDICNQVLKDHSKAKELLPTMSGFFFGSTDYNEYYFKNVEFVRDWVKDTLIPEFDSLKDGECIEFSTWY